MSTHVAVDRSPGTASWIAPQSRSARASTRFGVRPAPLLVIRTDEARVEGDGIAVPADRRFAHESGVGLEAHVPGAFVLRAEAAALFSKDTELGDALIFAAGTERAFGDGTLSLTLRRGPPRRGSSAGQGHPSAARFWSRAARLS